MFLVSGANTGDKDTEDSGELAPYEITIMIDKPPLHAVMDIADNASPVVKQLWVYGILEKLNYQRDVDECSDSCPLTSVELQYQHSLGSSEITSPPHLLM